MDLFNERFAKHDDQHFHARRSLVLVGADRAFVDQQHRRGLGVPGDVSLVGFDDLAGSIYMVPPLTTVHNPIQEIGQLAARAMLSLLAGERPAQTHSITRSALEPDG